MGIRAPRRVFLLSCLGSLYAALGAAQCAGPRRAQARVAPNEAKAALIAKITSFVDWPASAGLNSGSSPFRVAVLGSADLAATLHTVFTEHPPQGHPARIRALEHADEVENAHLLFLAPGYAGDVSEVVRLFERTGTLTMGNAEGLCARGVAINLIGSDHQLGFEVNRVALRRAGLRASFHLLSRAHIVDGV